jgi:hypothetical protein
MSVSKKDKEWKESNILEREKEMRYWEEHKYKKWDIKGQRERERESGQQTEREESDTKEYIERQRSSLRTK